MKAASFCRCREEHTCALCLAVKRSGQRPLYASLSASVGWMRSARRAGSTQASNPTVSITADVISSASAHVREVHLRRERHEQHEHGVAGGDAAADEHERPARRCRRAGAPGLAPSAARSPISRVRRATLTDISEKIPAAERNRPRPTTADDRAGHDHLRHVLAPGEHRRAAARRRAAGRRRVRRRWRERAAPAPPGRRPSARPSPAETPSRATPRGTRTGPRRDRWASCRCREPCRRSRATAPASPGRSRHIARAGRPDSRRS